ncbi:hypothetical protein H4R34_000947 [Dimargaris verticillata]|uniref:Uncharacterized protein n=1 Tax=Dimargaris verticillata TaxID=2761393 RepID=A0A9W8B5P6_9FUNG|nr:hypothetical protein H4R34_000947 [Dimargaris verticillata]
MSDDDFGDFDDFEDFQEATFEDAQSHPAEPTPRAKPLALDDGDWANQDPWRQDSTCAAEPPETPAPVLSVPAVADRPADQVKAALGQACGRVIFELFVAPLATQDDCPTNQVIFNRCNTMRRDPTASMVARDRSVTADPTYWSKLLDCLYSSPLRQPPWEGSATETQCLKALQLKRRVIPCTITAWLKKVFKFERTPSPTWIEMTFQRLLKAVRDRAQRSQSGTRYRFDYLDADAPLSFVHSVPPRPSWQGTPTQGQASPSPTLASLKDDSVLNQPFDPSPSLRALVERLPDLSYMLTDKLCIE